jgi:hypothetical protein
MIMMHSIPLAALLLLSSGFASGQVASGANSNTGPLSDLALMRVGGGNARRVRLSESERRTG